MTILKLVKYIDPVLYTKTEPFDFEKDGDPVAYANDLRETADHYGGYGLSDNQVGRNKAVFVFGINGDYVAVFNPVITYVSTDTSMMDEGCLSFPGLVAKIERANEIRTRYMNDKGELQVHRFAGLTARIFQHEYGHLQGKPFFSGFSKLKVDMMVKKCHKATKIDYSTRELMSLRA